MIHKLKCTITTKFRDYSVLKFGVEIHATLHHMFGIGESKIVFNVQSTKFKALGRYLHNSTMKSYF